LIPQCPRLSSIYRGLLTTALFRCYGEFDLIDLFL